MNFPVFMICGVNAVRAVKTADGGLDVEVWDFVERRFKRDMSFAGRVFNPKPEDDVVSESELYVRIGALEKERAARH